MATTPKTRAKTNKKAVSKKTEEQNVVAKTLAKEIIVRPLSTEKLARQGEGVYGFRVALSATKISVMQAVHALYGVRPARVHMMNKIGKQVRYGRQQGRHADWKKAIVYLKKGEHMDVHTGV